MDTLNAGNAAIGNSGTHLKAIVSKVPEITLVFWIIKIVATTLAKPAVTRCP